MSFLSGFHIESAVIIEKISLIPVCAEMTRAFHSDNDFILKKPREEYPWLCLCVAEEGLLGAYFSRSIVWEVIFFQAYRKNRIHHNFLCSEV